MSAQEMMDYCLGPNSQGFIFAVSKFAVVGFLCALDVVSKK